MSKGHQYFLSLAISRKFHLAYTVIFNSVFTRVTPHALIACHFSAVTMEFPHCETTKEVQKQSQNTDWVNIWEINAHYT